MKKCVSKPEINDTKTYNNGVKVVPSYLLKPVSVDFSNWKAALVDTSRDALIDYLHGDYAEADEVLVSRASARLTPRN